MKCVVHDCKNEEWAGKFVGNLCAPCHKFFTEMIEIDTYSQGAKNFVIDCKNYLKNSEIYIIQQKYK